MSYVTCTASVSSCSSEKVPSASGAVVPSTSERGSRDVTPRVCHRTTRTSTVLGSTTERNTPSHALACPPKPLRSRVRISSSRCFSSTESSLPSLYLSSSALPLKSTLPLLTTCSGPPRRASFSRLATMSRSNSSSRTSSLLLSLLTARIALRMRRSNPKGANTRKMAEPAEEVRRYEKARRSTRIRRRDWTTRRRSQRSARTRTTVTEVSRRRDTTRRRHPKPSLSE
mmetsp:Transcript_2577/g.6296  ORF Transcript_2577/g.6296 Transcript_2577/m.6296 type:complete len:228 (+) Transcript_2577:628-1311(+)